MPIASLGASMLLLLGVGQVESAPQKWRYVIPPLGQGFAHAPLRALTLSANKPQDLQETASYRGTHRRYASLDYGFGRAAPLAIVVDEGPGFLDVYVDTDRDRVVSDKERLRESNGTWQIAVPAMWQEGLTVDELPRSLLLKFSKVTKTLSVATCGYIEGQAELDGTLATIRRVDGDANGLFADPQDRIWIDINRDGRWDSAQEEFLVAPFLKLRGRRWVVRADARGARLTVAPLEGTGKLTLVLPRRLAPHQVTAIEATLQSEDGIVASLRSLNDELTVPTGRYRISTLQLTLKSSTGPDWGFVFSDNDGRPKRRWLDVQRDATAKLNPLDKLEMGFAPLDEVRAGQSLFVRPTLHTGDGLLIERAYRGAVGSNANAADCVGRILVAIGDTIHDSATSGFS